MDVDGSSYIVEMQKYNQKNFFKRLFVASEIAQFDEIKRIKYEEDMKKI